MSKMSSSTAREPDCTTPDRQPADPTPPFAKLVRRGGRAPRAPVQHALGRDRCAYSASSGVFAAVSGDANPLADHVVFLIDADGRIQLENHCDALPSKLAESFLRLSKQIGPFEEFQWLLVVILPFGPIVLECKASIPIPCKRLSRNP